MRAMQTNRSAGGPSRNQRTDRSVQSTCRASGARSSTARFAPSDSGAFAQPPASSAAAASATSLTAGGRRGAALRRTRPRAGAAWRPSPHGLAVEALDGEALAAAVAHVRDERAERDAQPLVVGLAK